MLKVLDWNTAGEQEKQQAFSRPALNNDRQETVAAIINRVRQEGDAALYDLTRQLGGVMLNSLRVSQAAMDQSRIEAQALEAIKQAIQTISQFHQVMMPKPIQLETAAGVQLQRLYRPIQRVGLYVPGGQGAPLVSSVLMQAIPARLAGCPVRIMCTPPGADGRVDPHLLVAARLCQMEHVFAVGGAQAIAAMAYGTATIPKVDKLFGPGNAWVTEAKKQVSIDPKGAAQDMPAGPSEVLIVADEQARPDWIAADLLAQAEHGPDSQVLLICESSTMAAAVNQALAYQIQALPRQSIIKASLQQGGIVVATDRAVQLNLINEYAPEHLIINRVDAASWIEGIQAAGTIFLGPLAAETLGDYITGSNHVLPTYGFARNHSGLSVDDFLIGMTVQSISETGLNNLGPAAETLAQVEGLAAHAAAVRIRLNALKG